MSNVNKKKSKATLMVGAIPHSMYDLRDSLRAANKEAKEYLDQLAPLRQENARLSERLEAFERARRMILELLGVDSSKG